MDRGYFQYSDNARFGIDLDLCKLAASLILAVAQVVRDVLAFGGQRVSRDTTANFSESHGTRGVETYPHRAITCFQVLALGSQDGGGQAKEFFLEMGSRLTYCRSGGRCCATAARRHCVWIA